MEGSVKTQDEIKKQIDAISSDVRLSYKPANVKTNAPLALIQVDLEARIMALKWVLGEVKDDSSEWLY